MDDKRQRRPWRACADHIEGFGAVDAQRLARRARLEFQRQHAHADQVGPVDALEALGDDRLHAGQAHALRRPVARAALAVIRAGDDDQRLLAIHVGFDRLPHARHLAVRFDPRQRALLHRAVDHRHLVDQLRVGEGRALRGEMIAAVCGVGIEVLFRQAHLRQVFAGGAVEQDRVARRQVVGGDVVRQHRQRAHPAQGAFAGQRAFPVRRAADVGALRAPVVQRFRTLAVFDAHREHRVVHAAELFRLHRGFHDRIDLGIRRPDVLQRDRLAIGIEAQRIFFDVEAHGAGDGVGDHQRRRGEEGLLRIRMDAAVEVAVARQHRGRVQVAVDDFLLDRRIQRAAHAVAGGAGEGDDAEAEFFELREEIRFLQVQLHRLRARRQRGLHPRLAGQALRIRVAREQRGGDHVARVRCIRAAGDRGDDHRAVRHQAGRFLGLAGGELGFVGDALGGEVGGGDACMRVGRAGHRAHHARQVELQRAFVLRGRQRVGPQAGGLRVGLDQGDLFVAAAGQAQVIQGLLVDEEQRRGRAVFRRHVADRRAVAQRERGRTFAMEFEVGADHLRLAQEFGQRQHDVGGGDAGLRLAAEFDADDLRQPHPRGAAEHHVLRFQPADADRDHAERIHVRRMRIGADAGVGIGDAALDADHRRHLLQVDLVHDPVARGDHVDVVERALGPLDEVEAVLVAAVLDRAVLGERIRVVAAAFHRQRVVDDQLHRHHRIHRGGIAALLGDRVAQAGQVDQRGLAEDVVADHARREPREVEVAAAFDQLAQVGIAHRRVGLAHDVFGVDAGGVGQGGPGAGLQCLDRRGRIEPVEFGTG